MRSKNIKLIEIRDWATAIPAWAILMLPETEEELFLMKHCGYGMSHPCVMLISIAAPWTSAKSSDEWSNSVRTMPIAHQYIEKHFDELISGSVVDVEHILGEKDKPRQSMIYEELRKLVEPLSNPGAE